jgi:hypothetical protein
VPEEARNDTEPNQTPTGPLVHLWDRAKFQGTRDGLLQAWCGRRVAGPLVCLDRARATCKRCLDREAADNHMDRWAYNAPTDSDLGIVES